MSALGHKRTFAVQTGMSALLPEADNLAYSLEADGLGAKRLPQIG